MPTTMRHTSHMYTQYQESQHNIVTIKLDHKIGSRSPQLRPILQDALLHMLLRQKVAVVLLNQIQVILKAVIKNCN